MTLWGGILNALHRFAAAAAAPILLNLSMMATLALAPMFGGAGHAAAWGVLISGVLQALLVGGDAWRAGVMTAFHALRSDDDVRRFFKALVPATIGSAGTQLALFADTIIASFLPTGALSALYYADRIDQLPIGVIGIAVGTVLLPEMTQPLAAGDEAGARAAQSRAIEFALLLALPCVVAFLVHARPHHARLCSCAAVSRADDAHAAAMTLIAYTIGLIPFVLMRSVVAPFLARGDTATPVKAALTGTAVNIALQDRADGLAGAGRAGAGDLDRRLDQFRARALVRPPRRALRLRCGIAVLARQARDRQWRLRDLPAGRGPRRHRVVTVVA